MPFVKFLQDRTTVEDVPQVFKANQVVELSEESCQRWIRRGIAVDWTARLDVSTIKDAQPVTEPAPHQTTYAEMVAEPPAPPKPAAKRTRKA